MYIYRVGQRFSCSGIRFIHSLIYTHPSGSSDQQVSDFVKVKPATGGSGESQFQRRGDGLSSIIGDEFFICSVTFCSPKYLYPVFWRSRGANRLNINLYPTVKQAIIGAFICSFIIIDRIIVIR
ncbi:hypothetical protein SDC9_135732 [bioreactor metagenome]|uniref:Uncharacterized protein n=1 Tax=bioreactor metagenome TaxID=1076179 RepID=A0A645DHY8_9ZZZZ